MRLLTGTSPCTPDSGSSRLYPDSVCSHLSSERCDRRGDIGRILGSKLLSPLLVLETPRLGGALVYTVRHHCCKFLASCSEERVQIAERVALLRRLGDRLASSAEVNLQGPQELFSAPSVVSIEAVAVQQSCEGADVSVPG